MGEAHRVPRQTRQALRSTIDIRALLTNRDYIKTTTYVLPRGAKVRVLNLLEHLRRTRRDRRLTSADSRAGVLPEMTGAELVREINWRIGTLPPRDAETVARYVRHLTRWRSERHRRRDRQDARPGPPPAPDRSP